METGAVTVTEASVRLAHFCAIAGYWRRYADSAEPRGQTSIFARRPEHPAYFSPGLWRSPVFRNEWWYVTGWLETPDKKPLGFQITFFRVATEHDRANPSRFAPKQLIIAHAALSDPAVGNCCMIKKARARVLVWPIPKKAIRM